MTCKHTVALAGLGLILLAPMGRTEGAQAGAKPALVRVYIPADAKLEFDDTPTKQTGEVRLFETPPLTPGKKYVYTLKMTANEGRGTVRMQLAEVRAGEETRVDFRPGKDKASSQIIYVPTDQEIVDKMLKMAAVGKNDLVFDLGCGDGRIVASAAKVYGARGVGVDIDPQRIREAQDNVRKANVEKLVDIRLGDALKVPDLSQATVVMLYMLPEFMAKLQPILENTLKPGTRVVAHDFPVPDWKPLEVVTVEGPDWEHTLYLYKVPAEKK